MPTPPGSPVPWSQQFEKELFAYQMISARINEADSKMWQAPSLTLTAQAFLLTITLSADFDSAGHIVGAALGALIAWMSLQLMSKHRFFHQLDTAMLDELEKQTDLLGVSQYAWPPQVQLPTKTWLDKRRSIVVWKRGIIVIFAVNVALIPATIWLGDWF